MRLRYYLAGMFLAFGLAALAGFKVGNDSGDASDVFYSVWAFIVAIALVAALVAWKDSR